MLRDRAHHQRYACFDERHVDFLTLARFEPTYIRGEYAVARPHRGDDVAKRIPHGDRRTISVDGGCGEPAFRKRNHVDAGIFRLGTGVAIARE